MSSHQQPARPKSRKHIPDAVKDVMARVSFQPGVRVADIVAAGQGSSSALYRSRAEIKVDDKVKTRSMSSGRPSPFPPIVMEYALALFHFRPAFYLDEVVGLIKRFHGYTVNKSTVCRWLKNNNVTRKRLTRPAREQDGHRVLRWTLMMGQFDASQLCFADETHADRRTGVRKNGYSPEGTRAVSSTFFVRGKRFTLLPAMSQDGIFAPWVVEGSVNGERFEWWLEHQCLPLMNPYPGPQSVLVMDNASTHKGARVRELVEEAGCILIYLPPYSPELNPIELAFSVDKRSLMRTAVIEESDLMHAAKNSITSEGAKNMFAHCGFI
ncbi:unnamed protein product [Tilletia laevis]|uniref:Tc1-like transposase DDE domain-containing protein n=2 Tax=Tilletia TaxID=13289 RepID=A0A9N8LRP5_9BASI|nr:unnamed protein product [Tilletia caries]CAD6925014.1 unnamed protein product [Tilletia laevis]CAD6937024.1 unnamed protein product [Tilletia caries]CAD6946554.1 unnamed protein product [Tilletia laevis]CAD6950691.1 unnamed protein product [Tilletia caries]